MTLPPSELPKALSDRVSAVEEDGSLYIILIEAQLGNVPLAQCQMLAPPSVVSVA